MISASHVVAAALLTVGLLAWIAHMGEPRAGLRALYFQVHAG